MHRAGIKLSPGTYHVVPKVEDAYHVHLPCTYFRTTPFEVDFSGVFFYFTVRFPPVCMRATSSAAVLLIDCLVLQTMNTLTCLI